MVPSSRGDTDTHTHRDALSTHKRRKGMRETMRKEEEEKKNERFHEFRSGRSNRRWRIVRHISVRQVISHFRSKSFFFFQSFSTKCGRENVRRNFDGPLIQSRELRSSKFQKMMEILVKDGGSNSLSVCFSLSLSPLKNMMTHPQTNRARADEKRRRARRRAH